MSQVIARYFAIHSGAIGGAVILWALFLQNAPLRRGTLARWMSLTPRSDRDCVYSFVVRAFNEIHNAIAANHITG